MPSSATDLSTAPDALETRALAVALDAARVAGDLALAHFRVGERTSARVWAKHGGSPVTDADIAVDTLLKARLGTAFPEAGWLSEETADNPARLNDRLVWIVDPIDGTRAFMSGLAEWSVAIALVLDGRPLAGVVHAPALGATYAAARGRGATRDGAPIAASDRDTLAGARIAGPRGLVRALKAQQPEIEVVDHVPSLALRIARVAEGAVDASLVSATACDWDLAAADLILTEAGGAVTTIVGDGLRYNTPRTDHPALIACGRSIGAVFGAAARRLERSGRFV